MQLLKRFSLILGLCACCGHTFAEVVILEQGPHHRVVARVNQVTNLAGETVTVTNSYVELGSGMHYLKDGQWEPSAPVLETDADGAVLRNASYGARFKKEDNFAREPSLEWRWQPYYP